MDERVLQVLRRVADGVLCGEEDVPYTAGYAVFTCAFCHHGDRAPYHYPECEVLLAGQVLDELEELEEEYHD